MIRKFFLTTALVVAPLMALAEDTDKVLSIGGSVTEIVYALGQQDRLIARDSTSSFPAEATALPDVGYMRALSPEGVLSVGPELIISEDGAGPVETIDVLNQANIPFVVIPDNYSGEGIAEKIIAVGEALEVEGAAEALAADVTAKIAEAEATAANLAGGEKQRVLFILSTQGGRIMASGTNTAAHGIITMAGGINVIDSFDGYKQLSDEAISAAAPDVILMMDRGGDHGAANEELFAFPGLIGTPAAQTESVIRMNGLYLLGFGPRTGDAVLDLAQALYAG
jgi:iron complex transport system substrate-binding protein